MLESATGLKFELDGPALHGTIARKSLIPGEVVSVDGYQGTVKKTLLARMRIDPEVQCLFVSRAGTTLIWGENERRWFVLPPQTVSYTRGPQNLLLNFARGEHKLESISWNGRNTPFLAEWLDRHRTKGGRIERPRLLATMPVNPIFRAPIDRLDEACAGNPDLAEPLIFSVFYEILPKLVKSKSRLGLAPVPGDLPQNIIQLIQQVRQKPDVAWPLKDAADFVGYSPFHFSRVYKSLIGYGFHEFVDRCRTEHAVEMLCTSDVPIDVVAAASGFGTTQALRESVKEYLGLVPSELRSTPDEYNAMR